MKAGYTFNIIYGTIKPFMKQRQKDRVESIGYSNAEILKALTTLIEADQIFKEYGGSG